MKSTPLMLWTSINIVSDYGGIERLGQAINSLLQDKTALPHMIVYKDELMSLPRC